MTKFVLVFRGGQPDTPEAGQKMMADWNTWMEDLGSKMVDPGAAVGKSRFLTAPATEGKVEGAISGYSVIEAADFDEALALAGKCPIFDGNGTIEVAESIDM